MDSEITKVFRVKIPDNETKMRKSRQSIPFFLEPGN